MHNRSVSFTCRKQHLLLIAIAGLAVILAFSLEAQAGDFFADLFKKNKNKKSEEKVNELTAQSSKAADDQGQVTPEAGSEKLASELMRMDNEQRSSPHRRRRPDVSGILAAAREQEKISQNIGNEPEQIDEEPDLHESQPPEVPMPDMYGDNPPIAAHRKGFHEYYEEDGSRPESRPTARFGPRVESLIEKNKEMNRNYVNTEAKPADAKERGILKPNLIYSKDAHLQLKQTKKSSLFSGSGLKKRVGKVYKGTKTSLVSAGKALGDIPKMVQEVSETVSAKLQLDNRGILLAMIEDVNQQIKYIKKEFSQFTIDWSYMMERSLNYLGTENLDNLRWNDKDELDFRRDALHTLTFGYELARLFIAWRENLLVAHEAYKLYLETVIEDLCDNRKSGDPKIEVDDFMKMQLEGVHSYLLLTSWLDIDSTTLEPRMKLEYLMKVQDDKPKNYESEYFRYITVMQEIYDPTIEEFKTAKDFVLDHVAQAAFTPEKIEDIDKFYDNFRNSLAQHEVKNVDWEVPRKMYDFLEMLRPQLQFNMLVYNKGFLRELKYEKERAAREEAENVA